MGRVRRIDHSDRLQGQPPVCLVEQPDPLAEQDGNQMDLDLVERSGLDEALRGSRAAPDRDVLDRWEVRP